MKHSINFKKSTIALALFSGLSGANSTEFSSAEMRDATNFVFQVPVIGLNANDAKPQIFLEVKTDDPVSRSLSHRVFLSDNKTSALVRVTSVVAKKNETIKFDLIVRDSEGKYKKSYTATPDGKIQESKTVVEFNKEIQEKLLKQEQQRIAEMKAKADVGKVDFYDFKPVSLDVVKPGQTLRQMALPYSRKMASQTHLPTVSQTMAALYVMNKQAFKDGDVSKLMVDYTLRVPDANTIKSIPHEEARAFLKAADAGNMKPQILTKYVDGLKSRIQADAAIKKADESKLSAYKAVEENKPTGPVQIGENQVSEIRLVNQTGEPDYTAEDELAQRLGINREKDEFLNKNESDIAAMKDAIAQVSQTLTQGASVLNIRANSNVDLLNENQTAEDMVPVYVDQDKQTYGPSYAEDGNKTETEQNAKANYEQTLKDEVKNYEIVQAEDEAKFAYGDKIEVDDKPVTLDSLEEETKQTLGQEFSTLGFFGFVNKYGMYVYSALALLSLISIASLMLLLRKKKRNSSTVGEEISVGLDKRAEFNPYNKNKPSMQSAGIASAGSAAYSGQSKQKSDESALVEEFDDEDSDDFAQIEKQRIEDAPAKGLKDRYSKDKAVIAKEAMRYGFDPDPVQQEESVAVAVASVADKKVQASVVVNKESPKTAQKEEGDYAEISAKQFREAEQEIQEQGFSGSKARKIEKPEPMPRLEPAFVSDQPTSEIDFPVFEDLDEKLNQMARFKDEEELHIDSEYMNPEEIQPRKPVDQTLSESEMLAQAREIRELMGESVEDLTERNDEIGQTKEKELIKFEKPSIPEPSQNEEIDFSAFENLDEKLESMAKFKDEPIEDSLIDDGPSQIKEGNQQYDDHLIVDPVDPSEAPSTEEEKDGESAKSTPLKNELPEFDFGNTERENKELRAQEVISSSKANQELKELTGEDKEQPMSAEQLEIETMLELVDAYIQMEDTDSAGKLLISSIKGKLLTETQKSKVKEMITLIRERV